MADPDPAHPHSAVGPAAAQAEAHETAFTAEGAPQSSVNEPDPFNELENLYAENAGLKDKVLRTLADMENLRRRAEKEAADAKIYGVTALARDMLSFADNLRRALENLPDGAREAALPPLKTFVEGVELTERDFLSRLARHGVKKVEPLGQKFDPNLHEALFEIPDPGSPAGTVAQVVEAGYQIGDRVLRPAKVGVARGGPKTPAGVVDEPA
ncbi:MAG TPA: nucleotide exchange factor GrpE [Beijerinckiaceae bacterium]|nr:nucleotide exchange factor GrpE [Beijerinckiaceae bacterium]